MRNITLESFSTTVFRFGEAIVRPHCGSHELPTTKTQPLCMPSVDLIGTATVCGRTRTRGSPWSCKQLPWVSAKHSSRWESATAEGKGSPSTCGKPFVGIFVQQNVGTGTLPTTLLISTRRVEECGRISRRPNSGTVTRQENRGRNPGNTGTGTCEKIKISFFRLARNLQGPSDRRSYGLALRFSWRGTGLLPSIRREVYMILAKVTGPLFLRHPESEFPSVAVLVNSRPAARAAPGSRFSNLGLRFFLLRRMLTFRRQRHHQ
jgi:hypothetical protein